jgi:hypothetical protein
MSPESQPAPSSPELATCNLQPATTPPRRLKGKIAALPKDQRDAINKLLLDGSTYAVVIDRMAEQGISLNAENISNWFQTGFQEHLTHLERLDYQRAKYEAATDLLQNIDVSKLPEAGLQTAAAQIYDVLDRFTPAAIADTIADEPDKYIRIVNSLSRLTREALAIQKYTDARARAALRELDPKRKLDESETRAIVRKVDEILGLAPTTPGRDELHESPSLQMNGVAPIEVIPGSECLQPDREPSASPAAI